VLFRSDGLVSPEVRAAFPDARWESVARRVGTKVLTQAQVNARMIAAARRGRFVVRLKAGDPFVFGRGGEEAQALRAARVAFDVVPGVSSALSAPALVGIPVTHRGVASAFVVVSGHAEDNYGPILRALPDGMATVIVLMGMGQRRAIARLLIAAGWAGATPVAVIVNASRVDQRVWRGSLARLGVSDGITGRTQPGVIVIGRVVGDVSRSARK